MVKRLLAAAALMGAAVASIGVGCGDSGGAGGTDCATATVKPYSELSAAFGKCITCHSSDLVTPTERQLATDGFNYETYDLAKQFPDRIAVRIDADRSAAEGTTTMPPDGSPQLSPTEKTDMEAWADCGSPGP